MAGNEEKTDTAEKADIAEEDEPHTADTAEEGEPLADAPAVAAKSTPVDAQQKSTTARGLRISVSVRTLVVATLIAVLLASVGILTWLYVGEKAKLDEQARQADNNTHAEKIALDYAVDAAKINYQDLGTWKKNLVKGTTAELTEKLNDAGKSMEQILVPLQWNSTATPLIAKVRSNANGIYVVDAFVGVLTKTIQAQEGLQSTATYSITVDSTHNWQISEVGGIGAVVGQK